MKTNRQRKTAKLTLVLLLCLFAFLFPQAARAQGGLLSGGIIVISSSGRPVGGATVTVCNIADQGVPCTQTVSIFKDPALTIPAPNPGITDGNGNFIVFAAAGSYSYTVTGNGVSTVGQPFSTTSTGSAANPAVFNTAFYVGGANSSVWGGGDIGSQINAAYTALPATGGYIYILPNIGGGCYNQTTTVNLTTVSKPFVIRMIGAPEILGTTGTCINWPSTSGTAFNVDILSAPSNGFSGGVGFRDFTLSNNGCITNGGCSSNAIGIQVGISNGGLRNGRWDNVNVTGFGKGLQFSDPGGVGWGNVFTGGNFSYNTTGINYAVGHENDTYIGVKWLDNQTGLNVLGDVTLVGGSLDANLTTGVALTGNAILNTTDVHWENNGPANIAYVTGGVSTGLFMKGGIVADDTSGGSSSQSFFTFGIGSITGIDMFGGNGGRTYSNPAVNCVTRCSVNLYNGNATAWPTMNSICPPSSCSPFAVTAQAPFSNSFTQTLTNAFVGIGLVTNSSIFYLRDHTSGGTVIATVDNATTNVVLTGAAGAAAGANFVVGTAGTNQVGVRWTGTVFQIEGNGTAVGDVIHYTQVLLD